IERGRDRLAWLKAHYVVDRFWRGVAAAEQGQRLAARKGICSPGASRNAAHDVAGPVIDGIDRREDQTDPQGELAPVALAAAEQVQRLAARKGICSPGESRTAAHDVAGPVIDGIDRREDPIDPQAELAPVALAAAELIEAVDFPSVQETARVEIPLETRGGD